jgi:hypothetical protein
MPPITAKDANALAARVAKELADTSVVMTDPYLGEQFWPFRVIGHGIIATTGEAVVLVEDARQGTPWDEYCLKLKPGFVLTATMKGLPVWGYAPRYFQHALAAEPKKDLSRYPHRCPKCQSPAYLGFNSIECSKDGCGR